MIDAISQTTGAVGAGGARGYSPPNNLVDALFFDEKFLKPRLNHKPALFVPLCHFSTFTLLSIEMNFLKRSDDGNRRDQPITHILYTEYFPTKNIGLLPAYYIHANV